MSHDGISSNFTCTCGWGFQQESAFSRHQKTCIKGKKRLFSALSKAKDLLGSVKRARLCISEHARPSGSQPCTSLDASPPLSISPHLRTNKEVPSNNATASTSMLLQDNASIPTCNLTHQGHKDTSHGDTPLAQWRTRHSGIQLPKCYRQFEDVLPQSLPSVPINNVHQSSEPPPP